MILDGLLQFDSAANLALAVGTYNSTNVIDLGVTSGIPTSANGGGARDIGIGDDPAMKLLVDITTTFTSGGAGTLALVALAPLVGKPDEDGCPAFFRMVQSETGRISDWEDVDFSWRATKLGYVVGNPEAKRKK